MGNACGRLQPVDPALRIYHYNTNQGDDGDGRLIATGPETEVHTTMDEQKDLSAQEDSAAGTEESESPPVDTATTDDPTIRAETHEDPSADAETPPTRRGWMRHPTRRVFGGVCGGLADFLGISEGLVRLFYLALVIFTGGVALPLYLLFWLFLPQGTQETGKTGDATIELQAKHGRWFAYGLIGLGMILLAVNLGIFELLGAVAHVILAPGILVLIGFLILRKFHRKSLTQDIRNAKAGARKVSEATTRWSTKARKSPLGLYRSADDKVVAGVCGGLGKTLAVDPLLIRLAFVILALVTAVVGMIILYAILALLMPLEDTRNGDSMDDVSGSAAIEPAS